MHELGTQQKQDIAAARQAHAKSAGWRAYGTSRNGLAAALGLRLLPLFQGRGAGKAQVGANVRHRSQAGMRACMGVYTCEAHLHTHTPTHAHAHVHNTAHTHAHITLQTYAHAHAHTRTRTRPQQEHQSAADRKRAIQALAQRAMVRGSGMGAWASACHAELARPMLTGTVCQPVQELHCQVAPISQRTAVPPLHTVAASAVLAAQGHATPAALL